MSYAEISRSEAESNQNTCLDALSQHGIFVVPSFLNDKELKAITEHCRQELGQLPRDRYAFGKTKKYQKEELSHYPSLEKLFNSKFMESLCTRYLGPGSEANSTVVLTQEFKYTGERARNGDLHFDRLHSLKFFFYITDVDRNNGAFHAVPGSHLKTRALREKEWNRTGDYDDLKNRPALDYPELALTERDAVPVEAPAGSLIVFDTDCLHFGGFVHDERSRIVLRGHCRDAKTLQKMKKPSLLKRFIERAKSLAASA